mmetsp:Transcript_61712/g.114563  ORF Transcript_61712/g.114563 Transcript_61712/m.114563 type:complete len:220 (-) Transcript_61712:528-1187(-)
MLNRVVNCARLLRLVLSGVAAKVLTAGAPSLTRTATAPGCRPFATRLERRLLSGCALLADALLSWELEAAPCDGSVGGRPMVCVLASCVPVRPPPACVPTLVCCRPAMLSVQLLMDSVAHFLPGAITSSGELSKRRAVCCFGAHGAARRVCSCRCSTWSPTLFTDSGWDASTSSALLHWSRGTSTCRGTGMNARGCLPGKLRNSPTTWTQNPVLLPSIL